MGYKKRPSAGWAALWQNLQLDLEIGLDLLGGLDGILINGKVAKASQAVNAGDIIEVTFGNRPIKVRVLSDVEPRTKDVAREMYEVIAE